MTYEQYWYGDPLMVRAYYQANELRKQRVDAEAWLYGAYVYKAVEVVVGNVLKKKGTPGSEYPAMPIVMKSEKKELDLPPEQQAVFAKAYMKQMIRAGKNWGS